MKSRRRRVLVAGLATGWLACSRSGFAQTQPSGRDAALRTLAARLDLPLIDEAVAIFSKQLRRTLPTTFVDGIGDNLGLGPQWRPGNPDFDSALRQIDAALGAEEARGGPLLKLDRGDLLYAVNIPWTLDDIAFVSATLDTDLGHEAQRALDAKAAQQTIATLRRRVAVGPGGQDIKAAFADLDARAQAQFGDAMLMLLAMRGTDPVRTQRLQRLVEAVTIAPSDAIGQRVVDRLSQRLLDAAAAQLPGLLGSIRLGS
jgi:hypothetical protein